MGLQRVSTTERLSTAQRLKDEHLGQMETCLSSLVATARVGREAGPGLEKSGRRLSEAQESTWTSSPRAMWISQILQIKPFLPLRIHGDSWKEKAGTMAPDPLVFQGNQRNEDLRRRGCPRALKWMTGPQKSPPWRLFKTSSWVRGARRGPQALIPLSSVWI